MIKRLLYFCVFLLVMLPIASWASDDASDEQSRPKLTVEVHGVDDPLQDNIREWLQAEFNRLPQHDPTTVNQWYADSDQLVNQALKPFGYFKAQVKRLGIKQDGHLWHAVYQVNKGKPLKVTHLNIRIVGSGHDNQVIRNALTKIPLHKGGRFQVDAYNDIKSQLLSVAQHQGYIKAKVTKDRVNIDLDEYNCDIKITIDTKQQYYFGNVSFSDGPLSEAFLKRYLNFEPGEAFDSSSLMNLQDNLSGSGYFRTVQVDPDIDHADSHDNVPINIQTNMNKKHRYRFGLGYGNVSGVRVKGGADWRWINRYGHQINANLTWSQVNRNVEAQYVIPGEEPTQDQYILNTGLYTLHPEGGSSKVAKIGAKFQSQQGKWQYHYGVDYSFERFKTDLHPEYQQSHILVPNVGLGWISTQKPISIDRGARFHVFLRGTGGPLSSKTDFLQTKFRGKVLETLWNDNRFSLQGQLGYTWIDNVAKLPLSYQFYTGGPNSVRGYEVQGIGPGRYLAELSGEYQRRVYGNWFASIFYDVGSAVENFADVDSEFKRSVGIGVVWQSPVGNLQAYLAHPIDRDRSVSFNISLGPEL